jgi:hypothetical protein
MLTALIGVLFQREQAAAEADVAGQGQWWVQTATPNLPMFTDDAGTDFQLATVSGVAAAYQPLDADLTSWAGVTRASGFDTFVATPSQANFMSLITDETFVVDADIGSTVQAYDAQLDTWAGLTPSANAQSLVTAANYAAMRALLDLEAGTDFYSIAAADAAFQPKDADLTTLATAFTTASASGAASLDFHEDTDNGSNRVRLQGPASTADVTVTLPAAACTLVGKDTTDTLTNKTIDANGTGNSITNIEAADIAAAALVTAADTVSGNDNDTSWPTTAAVIDYAQPLDADLTSWAGVTRAAGFDTFAATPSQANFMSLITDERFVVDADIGSTVQAYDADLASWAGVTRASGFDTFAATPSSANLASLVSDETGSGALVFATSPTLVTPALGTPASGTLTNCTGLPVSGLTTTVETVGTQQIWLDAKMLTPYTTNGAAAGTRDATNGDSHPYWAFDASTDEFVGCFIHIPDRWNLGTVTAKVFWSPTDTAGGNVVWSIGANSYDNANNINGIGTPQTVTDDASTLAFFMRISSESSAITIGGSPTDLELQFIEISRDANNASDTYTADAALWGVLLTYTSSGANDA